VAEAAYLYVHIALALRLPVVTVGYYWSILCSVVNRCWGFTAKL